MSSSVWELITDPALDGATNMAVDAALLSEVEASEKPLTVVRYYAWDRPTVSLGRNQALDKAVDVAFCRGRGLGVVHRPTGGRAVLHDDELTYAVASNDLASFGGGSIYSTYRTVSEALALGFRRMGVDPTLSPETRRMGRSNSGHDNPCFVSPSRYELIVDGRKIVGSAQRRLRRGFLQHGSMPITCDRELLARVTRFEDSALLETEMSGIAECLGRRPEIEEMAAVFASAFEDYFQVRFTRRSGSQTPVSGVR